MRYFLFLLVISTSICFSQYTEIYHSNLKNNSSLSEWSTDKPYAALWNNPIKIDSTPNGNRKFLGLFGDQSISLNLSNLPPHDSIKIEFQLFIVKTWDGNFTNDNCGPDVFSLRADNFYFYQTTFSNCNGKTQDYPSKYDKYSPQTNSYQYMADEVNSLGYFHNNTFGGNYYYGDAVYSFNNDKAFTIGHTANNISISFIADLIQNPSDPQDWSIVDESWGITLVSVSYNKCEVSASISNNGITSICKGDSLILLASPNVAGYSFEWSDGTKSNSLVVHDSGYYYVKVTNKYGCYDTVGVRIDLKPTPLANISGPNSFCEGDSVLLSAEPNDIEYSYEWSNGSKSKSIVVSDSGFYYVKVTNSNGCFDTAGIRLNIYKKPDINIIGLKTICKGETIKLSVEPDSTGFTYEWSNGSKSNSIYVSDSGYYFVKVTNQSGCTDSAGIHIDLAPKPIFQVKGQTAICEGDSAFIYVESDDIFLTYKWSNGVSSYSTYYTYPGLQYVIATNQYGCSDTAWFNIEYATKPNFHINGSTKICQGDSIMLSISPDNVNYSYEWSNGKTTNSIYVNDSGYYSVKVTNQFGCSDTAGIRIELLPKPIVDIFGLKTICEGDSIILSVNPDNDDYTYEWSNGSKLNSSIVSDSGYYSVKVTNEYGCSDTAGFRVDLNPKPEFTITGHKTLCQGDSIILQVEPDRYDYSYKWSNGNFSSSIIVTDTGYYYVEVTNQYGCSDTNGLRIDFNPTISLTIDTLHTKIGSENNAIKIKIEFYKFYKSILTDLYLHIGFDAYAFQPYNNQSYIKNNYIDDYGQRNLILELSNINLQGQDSIVLYIKGLTLLSDISVNKINILEFYSDDNAACIDTTSGVIILDSVCTYKLRGVRLFNLNELNIIPNPIDGDKFEVNFKGDEEGTHILKIFNVQGILIDTKQWVNQKNGNKTFEYDLREYSNGVYYIVLQTPWNLMTKHLMIIK